MKMSFADSLKSGLLQKAATEAVAEAGKVARAHKLPPAGIVEQAAPVSKRAKTVEVAARPAVRQPRETDRRAVASNKR